MLISLSDLHTPWPVIERRVAAAAAADLVTCFYNPRSRDRHWQLGAALDALRAHRPPDTPVGAVRQAGRPGQRVWTAPLAAFDPAEVDMLTTVVVGSSATRMVAGRMVTPRGYRWSAIPVTGATAGRPRRGWARAVAPGYAPAALRGNPVRVRDGPATVTSRDEPAGSQTPRRRPPSVPSGRGHPGRSHLRDDESASRSGCRTRSSSSPTRSCAPGSTPPTCRR